MSEIKACLYCNKPITDENNPTAVCNEDCFYGNIYYGKAGIFRAPSSAPPLSQRAANWLRSRVLKFKREDK